MPSDTRSSGSSGSSGSPRSPRTAWLAGATGLVGHALLLTLLRSPAYQRVHALVRRPVADLPGDQKLRHRIVDFARLPDDLPRCDDVYIALGTTIKAAGSKTAFRQVDFDLVLNASRAGRAAGATRLAVVSALGADANSRVFYNRVKGEMQDAVARLGFNAVTVAQPSLLLGDRAALGQPVRPGERWAARLLRPVLGVLPASVRPIEAGTVAAALLAGTLEERPGVRVLGSAEMQTLGRSEH